MIRAAWRRLWCSRHGHNVWRDSILRVCWACRGEPHPAPTDWTYAPVDEVVLPPPILTGLAGPDVLILDDEYSPSVAIDPEDVKAWGRQEGIPWQAKPARLFEPRSDDGDPDPTVFGRR